MDRHVMKKKKFYLYKKGVVLCLITIIQRKCDKIVMKKQENDEQMEKKFAIVKNGAKMEEKAKDTMGGGRMQYEGQIAGRRWSGDLICSRSRSDALITHVSFAHFLNIYSIGNCRLHRLRRNCKE